ncbi:MAG: RNA polymerase sigma factor [Polyangiaceae bacterium]|nr:RNA polymerase sigma factor [Polyangiaceae bacterium]
MERWIPTAMAMPSLPTPSVRADLLADPELYAALVRYARRRVAEHEVEDVVQSALADALAAPRTPETPEEVRRWVHRIARNKIVDLHRRRGREVPRELSGPDEAVADSAPVSARDLLRWAEKELPEGEGSQSTLEWMLREGDGEKLEHIADEANVPAPRVRQRVSRLRRHFRTRWAAQLAAVAAITALVLAAIALWRGLSQPSPEDIAREPVPELSPRERGQEIRRQAFEHCAAGRDRECLKELDRAKALDPAGDTEPRVQEARAAAQRALEAPSKGQLEKSAPPSKGQRAPDIEEMLKKGAPVKAPPSKPKLPSKSMTNPIPTDFPSPSLSEPVQSNQAVQKPKAEPQPKVPQKFDPSAK